MAVVTPNAPGVAKDFLKNLNASNPDIPTGIVDGNLNVLNEDVFSGGDSQGDLLGKIVDNEPQNPFAIWTDFRVFNFYEIDTHKYMAGITSPDPFQGDTAAFFQLANPTLLWLSRWTASRIDIMPNIPDPTTLEDKDWVLLDLEYEPVSIILMGNDQSPLYRISGLFTFGHKNPFKTGNILDLMSFGKPPWIDDSTIERKIGGNIQLIGDVMDVSTGEDAGEAIGTEENQSSENPDHGSGYPGLAFPGVP